MARKTITTVIDAFGDKVIAQEQHYLGNTSLPVQAKYAYTTKMLDALKKCKEDVCYFAENFFTIIDKTVRKKIPLRDYQRRALKKMQTEKRLIMLTSRQCGKTTLMTIYALWLAMFYPDQTIRIVANNLNRALEDLSRIRLAYEDMDNWVKQTVEEGSWNKGSIKFANGSTIAALATSGNSGRGDSISCILLDELAFVEEGIAQEFWRSVGPTLSANPNAQMFIASTPKGEGNLLWDLCTKSDAGENDFIVERVYWYDIPDRDEAWKQHVLKNDCNGDINYFEQEYECRFLGSSNSPFPQEVFDRLNKLTRPPIETLDDGRLSIWKYPENGRVYSIGVDVAEGIGKDYSVIEVFDLTNLDKVEQCACYYCNTINTLDFLKKILEVADMYGNPVLSIERNSCGTDICNRIALDYNYPHLVNHGSTKHGNYANFRWGIINSTQTRFPAIMNLKLWLSDSHKVVIYDERFVTELRNFEVNKTTNKWAAAPGFHDDIIMSTVWALNVLHKDLVEKQFIVEKWREDNKTVPARIINKFRYHIDEEMSKRLIVTKYGNNKFSRLPVALFGTQEEGLLTREKELEEKKKQVGEWICFLNERTPLGYQNNQPLPYFGRW